MPDPLRIDIERLAKSFGIPMLTGWAVSYPDGKCETHMHGSTSVAGAKLILYTGPAVPKED